LEFSERKFLLRSGDVVLILLGALGALLLWSFVAQRPFDFVLVQSQLPWMIAISLGWMTWLAIADTYNLRHAVNTRWSLQRIGLGAIGIGIVYVVYFFFTAIPAAASVFSGLALGNTPLRLAPGMAILATALLVAGWRVLYTALFGGPHSRRHVLILGAGYAGVTIAEALREHSTFKIVGFVDDDKQKMGTRIADVPVLAEHHLMLHLVESRSIDEIIVAISASMDGSLFQAVMDCHERGITITPMPLLYEQLTGKVAVEHIGSQWYVALPFENNGFDSLTRLAKRGLDILIGSLMALVFLLTLPIVALAIRLDSKGPIFYAQERMGLHGKVFKVVKYRSMVEDAERDGKAKWATKGDPRITRVGRFMRKTRIDELPQVINILRGEMSMVGPRPERPQFIEKLQKQIPFYRTRLAAKPGLTGWAQVSYGYGATTEDALIKLQYDLYYLKHQSVWFDLKILLRTIAVVLKMKGQ
jgi:exopolysaccharide biosynthesis polyprenyl glycosylphosphotransferase